MTAPRRLAVSSLHLRTTAALPLIPGIAALLVVNTVLRGHPWDHEWGWAIYQAGFVSVFLGPLCAGIGVWDGTQLARSHAVIDASGRPAAARTAAWLAITGIIAAIYLALLVVMGVMLKAGGILDGPGLIDLSPIPGVLALCGAWAALGVAVGYRWRTPLLAPVAAAAAFGLTLVLYLAQPFLIKVGGATSSTLFLEPRPAIQVGQLVLFGAITATALLGLPARAAVRPPQARRVAYAVAPAIAVGAIGYLVTVPGLEWRDRDRPLVCHGERPAICVASPYRDRADWPLPYLEPYVEALDDMGIEPPRTFTQAVDRPAGQGAIPDELLRGHPPAAGPYRSIGPGGAAVLGGYLGSSCDIFASPDLQAAYDLAERWLTSITTPDVLDDPTVAPVLRTGSHAARSAALQDAFTTLATCSS